MTANVRTVLRAAELADSATAARSISDLLMRIYLRLEAAESGVATALAAAAAADAAAAEVAGSLSIATVGGSPNDAAGTFVDGVLTLAEASETYPGVLSAQRFSQLLSLGVLSSVAATTTDATPTDIALTGLASNPNASYVLQVVVAGNEVSGVNGATYGLVGTFKFETGALTQVGSTTSLWAHETDAAWDCVLAVVGTGVVATVTGAAATTIDWEARTQIRVAVA